MTWKFVLGSGVFVAILTYILNAWATRRAFRKSKLEALYSAIQELTRTAFLEGSSWLGSSPTPQDKIGRIENLIQRIDSAELLVNLYFRQLHSPFDDYRKFVSNFATADGILAFISFVELLKAGQTLRKEVLAFATRCWLL
jgi:hypothetical protein